MSVVVALAFGVAAMALVGLGALHREALRRVVLGTVDPRPLALFRIALGACLLGYVVEIAPLSTYLFSDEGLLPTAAALQVYGRDALAGYGDGVRAPPGFHDLGSFVHYLASGHWSLLWFHDSPAFVHVHVAVLAAACIGITIGWRTRACTVLAWLLLTGLLRRGDAHWGGEQVLMGFLFPMMFARSGAAFGVDAWRRRGADLPRVPAWPQVIIVAQLAICYAANGWTKTGSTWISGDTLRLAVHLDRYARLDWHALAVAVGPWPFRLATWSVLWWERLFPLVLVGLWMRRVERQGAPSLSARASSASRLCWLAIVAAMFAWALTPAALSVRPVVASSRAWALGVSAMVIATVVVGYPSLQPRARLRLRTIAVRVLAPRIWLGFGLAFHGVSLVLFEIGTFASATVAAYLLCGAGPVCVMAFERMSSAITRRPPRPVEPETSAGAEPGLGSTALPGGAIVAAGAIVLTGGILALHRAPPAVAWWHGAWLLAAALLVWVGRRVARARTHDTASYPFAHGPAGRLAAGGLTTYHLVALLLWQMPAAPGIPWRDGAREVVDPWMRVSFTRQLWSMFAPNGPKSNVALRTIVVDGSGTAHDLRTEQQHPENLPRPYVWHDRWRKVHETVTGHRSWLTRWHARYVCRQWALDHDGISPQEVRLDRVTAPFAPMRPLDANEWFWAHAEVEQLVVVRCAEEPFAQLAPEIRRRHGLAPAGDGELHYAWPATPSPTDPLTPLWLLLAAGLGAWLSTHRRDSGRAS